MTAELAALLPLLRCPSCGGSLLKGKGTRALSCAACRSRFPIVCDLAILLTPQVLRAFRDSAGGRELYDADDDGFLTCDSAVGELAAARALTGGDGRLPDPAEDPVLAAGVSAANRRMAELAQVDRRSPILDLATGPGSFVQLIAPMLPVPSALICTEARARTLAATRGRLFPAFRGLALFVVCDVSTMPFATASVAAITSSGGTCEIANMDRILPQCCRVLQPGGLLVMTGDQYREGSPSIAVADRLGIGAIATRERLLGNLNGSGFGVTEYAVTYEGVDADALPDEERCPLPARGDWFSHCVVAAVKRG